MLYILTTAVTEIMHMLTLAAGHSQILMLSKIPFQKILVVRSKFGCCLTLPSFCFLEKALYLLIILFDKGI